MINDPAVVYSFCLYLLYVLLPLIPAILTFWLFPEANVAISGPLQGLTVKATGAFAAYVVTVLLGFFLVRQVEAQIVSTRRYPVEGVIVDLATDQGIGFDVKVYSRDDRSPKFANGDYHFVVLLDHPVEKDETVWVKYWQFDAAGGIGPPPAEKTVPLTLSKTSSPQLFKLLLQNDQPRFERVAGVGSSDLH